MRDLFSPLHTILIAFVVLLLFGGKKIPELMRGLGSGIREFKDAKDNVQREIEDEHIILIAFVVLLLFCLLLRRT